MNVKSFGFLLFFEKVLSCPYCAAGDTIGSSISAYIPLLGIIISPFIISGFFIMYVKRQK